MKIETTAWTRSPNGPTSEEPTRNAGGMAGEFAIPPVNSRVGSGSRHGRWGVILAGGDGVRLRPLTKFISGDERPKQFCTLFDQWTLLGQTLRRAERCIPQKQLMVSLTRNHSKWYSQEAGLYPCQRVVQPANKGTAPPILHSLLSLARLDEEALVAILPCDHHYADEQSFAAALECAFETAAERRDLVVLLGAQPDYPEVEYGWIELGSRLADEGSHVFRVRQFWEKPVIDVARSLLARESVWNTFVMVGHVRAYLQMVQAAVPDLLVMLRSAHVWTGQETHIEDSLYERLTPLSFCQEILSAVPNKLAVLRLNDVGWSDLGDPGRAVMAVRESGSNPPWIREWRLTRKRLPSPARAAAAVA